MSAWDPFIFILHSLLFPVLFFFKNLLFSCMSAFIDLSILPSFHPFIQPLDERVVLPVPPSTPALLYRSLHAPLLAAVDTPSPLLLSNLGLSLPLAPPLNPHPGPSTKHHQCPFCPRPLLHPTPNLIRHHQRPPRSQ